MPASSSIKYGFLLIDYIVLGVFLSLSVGVGVFYAIKSWRLQQVEEEKNEKSQGDKVATEDYLMGGRNMPVLPMALSLLTTFLSGIVMLGTPAEVFQREGSVTVDERAPLRREWRRPLSHVQLLNTIAISCLLWWLYYMTGAFAFIITGFFFLPMFFELKTTSIYEYFEHRFHSRTMRRMCATIFILNTVFYMSVVIYAPSVALSGLTNVGTWVFILVVGSVGTLYTTIGGLKAVVWADTLQAFFMYSGVGVLIVKGVNDAGGLERIWHVAIESGRVGDLNRWNPNPAQYNSLFISLFGGMSFWMSLYGLNQMTIQRYCALPTLADARKVLFITLPAFLLLSSMCCFIGLIMLAYFYNCNPLETGEIKTQDQLVIYFANRVLSFVPGLSGLFLACIFSATLSTISSGMNSLAVVTYEDFFKPHFHGRLNDAQSTKLNKMIVMLYGTLATGLAFAAEPLGGIIKASISMMGTLAGPLLGLFFLAFFYSKASKIGAFISFITSAVLCLSLWVWNFLENPYKHNFLPTNSTLEGCQETSFTIRYRPTEYDPHFGKLEVFYLARFSPYILPFFGIVLVVALGIPLSHIFPAGKQGIAVPLKRKQSLTYFGRRRVRDSGYASNETAQNGPESYVRRINNGVTNNGYSNKSGV